MKIMFPASEINKYKYEFTCGEGLTKSKPVSGNGCDYSLGQLSGEHPLASDNRINSELMAALI